ncbi:MAG TPA: hypothetical protein VJP80_07745 [Candidatus Saccharimonadales bacterium]|nr:hypothetical protein [Candidatus Saccharimonadales bacterium]
MHELNRPHTWCVGDCPNRGADLVPTDDLINGVYDCSGPVTVSRGRIISETRLSDDPDPPDDTWNVVVSVGDGIRCFSHTEWTATVVCGTEYIGPEGDEVPYAGDGHWLGLDDHRYAAFIGGLDSDIDDARGIQVLKFLLDGEG